MSFGGSGWVLLPLGKETSKRTFLMPAGGRKVLHLVALASG